MGKMLFGQGSENHAIHFQLAICMYYSQREGKKLKEAGEKKAVCVGAVYHCALVSAQVLYLVKNDNIIAAL